MFYVLRKKILHHLSIEHRVITLCKSYEGHENTGAGAGGRELKSLISLGFLILASSFESPENIQSILIQDSLRDQAAVGSQRFKDRANGRAIGR